MTPAFHRVQTALRGRPTRGRLLLVLVGAACLWACDSKSRGQQQTASSSDREVVSSTSAPVEDADEDHTQVQVPLDPPSKAALHEYTAHIEGEGPLWTRIETSLGAIHCQLYEERAPITVANFVGLATGKKSWFDAETGRVRRDVPYYDGVIFHRVIPNFLVQTGDRTSSGAIGPGYTLPDEFDPKLSHSEAGVLSMANKGRPDSAGSQWFITEAPAPHLDGRHSIFGKCRDIEAVKKIARVPTGPTNRPQDPPHIVDISFYRASDDLRVEQE
jgi:peptidyl-prolyl cis-trans isomerase A (cyclophilin A)